MKKLAIIIPLLLVSAAVIADITNEVDVSVKVNSKFELKVDRSNIDFENMDPGEVKNGVPAGGIRVSAKTNSGRPWYVTISTVKELSNGDDYIPNENFYWYGWKSKAANGTFYGKEKQIFTTEPALLYSPSSDEYNNMRLVKGKLEGTDVFVKFGLKVPLRQNSGDYHTIVRFTMTE